jgi:hypothetical protein
MTTAFFGSGRGTLGVLNTAIERGKYFRGQRLGHLVIMQGNTAMWTLRRPTRTSMMSVRHGSAMSELQRGEPYHWPTMLVSCKLDPHTTLVTSLRMLRFNMTK